jgi:hypothetical protein
VVKCNIGKAGEKAFLLCTRLTSICIKLSRALLYLGFSCLSGLSRAKGADVERLSEARRHSVLPAEHEGAENLSAVVR